MNKCGSDTNETPDSCMEKYNIEPSSSSSEGGPTVTTAWPIGTLAEVKELASLA
jgi:hypothetical protein